MVHLRLEGIEKRFTLDGAVLPVLAGVSFEVYRGELLSLIGPSGCGKTTLFNILSGLVPADGGAIYFEGELLPDIRGHVAYMQQKDLLLPWRTVLENAILGLELQGRPKGAARREARELLERFGLRGFEGAYPGELSGGMRQRVALARTFLCHKKILLLDEPFGALDALTRHSLHRWLLEAWEEFSSTILFVTHDIEEVLSLADRVVVLSARPAHVREVIAVGLPRPREPTSPRFVELKGRLWQLLREEIEIEREVAHGA